MTFEVENGFICLSIEYRKASNMALITNASITHITSLIDAEKTRGRVNYALRNNHKDFTFVLFEFTSSMAGVDIHQEQMTPYGMSLHAMLSQPEVITALRVLYCPNANFVLHTRRKIDHAGGVPTNMRQFVMKVYSTHYDDMPSLIPMNTTTPFVW